MYVTLKILEREQENVGCVFVYREKDGWYVYEQSVYHLSQMMEVTPEPFLVDGVVWMVRARVDIDQMPCEYITERSEGECTLRYVPDVNEYGDWVADIMPSFANT